MVRMLLILTPYSLKGDVPRTGTTFCHMDKSGAVNVMLLSNVASNASGEIGARWQIWPSEAISGLAKAMDPSATQTSCQLAQPIISELSFVTPDAAARAFEISGIPCWIIDQLPGDMVVIPPSCPHQVRFAVSLDD